MAPARPPARLVDEQGAPLGEILGSVCGPDCCYGTSDSAGHRVVAVGIHVAPEQWSLVLHGRLDRAGHYLPLPSLVDTRGGALTGTFTTPLLLPALPDGGTAVDLDGGVQTSPPAS